MSSKLFLQRRQCFDDCCNQLAEKAECYLHQHQTPCGEVVEKRTTIAGLSSTQMFALNCQIGSIQSGTNVHLSDTDRNDNQDTSTPMKVLSFLDQPYSSEFMLQKLFYDNYIEELKQMVAPYERSHDARLFGSRYCPSCDKRGAFLTNAEIANNALLQSQIKFITIKQDGKVVSGFSQLDRMYSVGFQQFPSCRELVVKSTLHLLNRLARCGPNVTGECSYKAQLAFIQGKSRWATKKEEEEESSCTYLPQLIILTSSMSSPARAVCVPNREIRTKDGKLRSYNSYIRSTNLSLPKLSLFHLSHILSHNWISFDFSDAFGSLRLSDRMARRGLVMVLKDKNNLPTYQWEESVDKRIHSLFSKRAMYGQKDIPNLSSLSIRNIVRNYKTFCEDINKVDILTLEHLDIVFNSLVYVDDGLICGNQFKVLEWCQWMNIEPPRPLCKCQDQCNQNTCSTLDMSDQHLRDFQTFMKIQSQHYLIHVSKSLVKIAAFTGYHIKFIQSPDAPTQKLIDELGIVQSQSVPESSHTEHIMKRPEISDTLAEIATCKKVQISSEDDQIDPIKPKEHSVTQLSKIYQNNKIFLKNQKLYISYFKKGCKKKSPKFSTFVDFMQFYTTESVVPSKLSLSAILGQQYDFVGKNLALCRCYFKQAMRQHCMSGDPSWDKPLSSECEALMLKGVECYFLLCSQALPKVVFSLHPNSQYIVVAGGDAGLHLNGTFICLVSILSLNGCHTATADHIVLNTFSNHTRLVEQVSVAELLAFHNVQLQLAQTLTDLETLGLKIPPSNVLLVCDSKVTILQLRSRAIWYRKRLRSLVTRIQMSLSDIDLCCYSNVAWIDQGKCPVWYADLLSKTRGAKSTAINMKHDFENLNNLDWLQQPLESWQLFIHRSYGLPKFDDNELISEVGFDPDYIHVVKEFLTTQRNNDISFTDQFPQVSHFLCQVAKKGHHDHQNCVGGGLSSDIEEQNQHDQSQHDHDDSYYENDVDDHDDHGGHGDHDGHSDHDGHEGCGDQDGHTEDKDHSGHGDHDGHDGCGDHDDHDDHGDNDQEPLPQKAKEAQSYPPLHRTSMNILPEHKMTQACHRGTQTCEQSSVHDDQVTFDHENLGHLSQSFKFMIESLISRKISYKLSHRSSISILSRCLYFVKKIKFLISLNRERRQKLRERRRIEYQSFENYTPYCGRIVCSKTNKVSPCDGNHLTQDDTSPQKYLSKRGLHSLFQSVNITHHNLRYIPPQKEIPFSNHCFAAELNHLKSEIFQLFCSWFGSEKSAKGFTQSKGKFKIFSLNLLYGRDQRCWLENKEYQVVLRSIDPQSQFSYLCLSTAHSVCQGQSPHQSKLYLLSLGIHISGYVDWLKLYSKKCTSCLLSKAYENRENHKIKSNHQSPSGLLHFLKHQPEAFAICTIDLAGPLYFVNHSRERVKMFILVAYSMPYGRTDFIPLRSQSTADLILGLSTMAIKHSCKYQLILSDKGSQMEPLATHTSPLTHNESSLPKTAEWFDELFLPQNVEKLADQGLFVVFGAHRHSVLSTSEVRVNSLKRLLHTFHCFSSHASPVDFFSILYLLSLAVHVVQSRPCIVTDTLILSNQERLSLYTKAGSLSSTKIGLKINRNSPSNQSQSIKILREDLSYLNSCVSSAMLEYSTSYILDNPHRREHFKTGITNKDVKVGSVIFDPGEFKQVLNFSASLGRIERIGTSKNHVIYSKSMFLKNNKVKKVLVSRPMSDLHFVCHPIEGEDVIFCQEPSIFDFESLKSEMIKNSELGRWSDEDQFVPPLSPSISQPTTPPPPPLPPPFPDLKTEKVKKKKVRWVDDMETDQSIIDLPSVRKSVSNKIDETVKYSSRGRKIIPSKKFHQN